MTTRLKTYIVFFSNGDTATHHSAHKATVETSGVLALYGVDESGADVLLTAFNPTVWREVRITTGPKDV